jgi:hypothetical protein
MPEMTMSTILEEVEAAATPCDVVTPVTLSYAPNENPRRTIELEPRSATFPLGRM